MHNALGIHVFAGGFGLGVAKTHNIVSHLETHGFGLESARNNLNIDVHNSPAAEWPAIEADWIFGNPRCTAFSALTGGCGENAHGPFAQQTVDIHELCNYGVEHDFPVICWESVQQAYTTGRPMLDYLRDELFVPNGYRIAHLFINASTFGNAQNRKRYFFVAYKGDRNFNIVPPELPDYYCGAYHKIYDLIDEPAVEDDGSEWGPNTYKRLHDDDKACLQYLQNGYGLNKLARHCYKLLPDRYQDVWKMRYSDIPFSLHTIYRIHWMTHCPTLTGRCGMLIHPRLHRPLTLRELSRLMGWGDHVPHGDDCYAQLGKGVCPEVGAWLAEQVTLYLNDEWGGDDWESSFCNKQYEWIGGDTNGAVEKVFDMTKYAPARMDETPEHITPLEHLWHCDRNGNRYYSDSALKEIQNAW